jgi:hypothetical protein
VWGVLYLTKGLGDDMNLYIGDKIYIYKVLNPEYKQEKIDPIRVSKKVTVVNDIQKNRYGQVKIKLVDTEGEYYSTIFASSVNAGHYWVEDLFKNYYSTVENDTFFKELFDDKRQVEHNRYLKMIENEKFNAIQCKENYLQHIIDSIEEKGIGTVFNKIQKSYNRYIENKNTKTFDTITCTIPLAGFSGSYKFTKKEIVQLLTPHRESIIKFVMDDINESKRFQKYNIPIGFLKVYKITVTNDMCLVINFELKEV